MDVMAAEASFGEWMLGANAMALLGAAERCGLIDMLRERRTVGEAAAELGLDVAQIGRVCMALEALRVVRRQGAVYVLTDAWQSLTAHDRPAVLADRLGLVRVVTRALAECFEPAPGFDGVDAEEAVALAASVWGVPQSAEARKSWEGLDDEMPEVRDAWRAGARHAEFGCGAGRDLLRVAAMYPQVTAVGYDVLPHVLEPAKELSAALGLGERVEFRLEDVTALSLVDEFDTIMWSQMFFSGADRTATIECIRRALKPGGLVVMPLMPDLPDPERVEATPANRSTLLLSVAYPRWKIHWPASDEVRSELVQAGFEHLHTLPHPRTPFMVLRSPG